MAIKIMRTLNEMNPVAEFKMTVGADSSMKDVVGSVITVNNFVHYCETKLDKEGKEKEVTLLAVEDRDGTVYTTNSNTFIKDFITIVDFFEGRSMLIPNITVVDGTSAAGRTYVTCKANFEGY